MNKKSVQEVSKHDLLGHFANEPTNHLPGRILGKTDARYWKGRLFRNSYSRAGERREVSDWCIKIAHAGRRETLNLRTPNQAAAAQRAADIYKALVGEGWEPVLEKWKPKPIATAKIATLGDFVSAVTAVSPARSATVWEYAKCLRRIAADVAGLLRDDGRKWDYRTGGADEWRATVDALPLSVLTPEKIQSWRLARVRDAGKSPAAQRSAKTTANSTIRKAKSLFSPKVLRFVQESLVIPPNPFDGVEFFERGSMRYESKIDAAALIEAARSELGGDPAKLEMWKAFVLLMFAGLRKNEADKLRWESVDFMVGLLRIEDHDHFQAKCEASKGSVELDPEVIALLRGWRALDTKGEFVLRSPVPPRENAHHYHYRAFRTFDALQAWLREKGIKARKALHELRKEAGSLVADKHGIFAASRFLRHSDIGITSKHYIDKKQRVTVGLGALLPASPPASKIMEFPGSAFGSESTKARNPSKRRTS